RLHLQQAERVLAEDLLDVERPGAGEGWSAFWRLPFSGLCVQDLAAASVSNRVVRVGMGSLRARGGCRRRATAPGAPRSRRRDPRAARPGMLTGVCAGVNHL